MRGERTDVIWYWFKEREEKWRSGTVVDRWWPDADKRMF
jgi:hypothetical protein